MNDQYTFVDVRGGKVYIRTRDNKRLGLDSIDPNFTPRLWLESSYPLETKCYRDYKHLEEYVFDTIYEAKEFLRNNQKEETVFGTPYFQYDYIAQEYPDSRSYDNTRVRVGIVDIEVYSKDTFPIAEQAAFPINAICYYDNFLDRFYLFATKQWNAEESELDSSIVNRVIYRRFDSEESLIRDFLNFYQENMPDAISGWNSDGFDWPYIFNRTRNVLGKSAASRYSPFNIINEGEKRNRFGNKEYSVRFFGVAHLDYLRLYLKHTFKKRESYKLDFIGHAELNEQKLSYEEYEGLADLYDNNPQKFYDYNIKDVDIVRRLDEKLQLFSLVFDIAYFSGINYEDTFSPVRTWDNLLYRYSLDKNRIVPIKASTFGGSDKIVGAFVKETQNRFHRWVVSFDLASLYPSIIRQWNMGPETIVEAGRIGQDLIGEACVRDILNNGVPEERTADLVNSGLTMAGNGFCYRTDMKSGFNEMMTLLYKERKSSKNKMIAAQKEGNNLLTSQMGTRQLALKVLLNSGFGSLSNQYFRFFDQRVAEGITLTGQLVIQWVANAVNDYLDNITGDKRDRVVAIDTDSIYLNLEDLVNKFAKDSPEEKIVSFLDQAARRIEQKCIHPSYENLRRILNCPEQLMIMDRETIASSGFWRAKKNYALRVLDMEGVRHKEPKLKIMGLEPVKSTFSEMDRNALTETIRIILEHRDNAELWNFVEEYRKKFMAQTPEEIASASKVNHIRKYDLGGDDVANMFAPKCPPNSKGAILYNHLLKRYNLTRLEPIEEGDSIFLLKLKTPNSIGSSVIAFKDYLPKEFDLEKWIDKEGLFKSGFLDPLKSYCNVVGWKVENEPDLMSFFS